MLSLNVTIAGDQAVINGLNQLSAALPQIIGRGIERIAKGTHRKAFDWLSGVGAMASNSGSGGYPVPVRTGHLRRSLDWVSPGATKSRDGHTFSAGAMETIVYDSAVYADTVHEGRGSSAKFGRRPFVEDAFKNFNEGGRAVEVLEDEIVKAAVARGFGV